jgi:NAD(P)-dependent dehydrogenase (short-subunit alcohol dehydrogenase family)
MPANPSQALEPFRSYLEVLARVHLDPLEKVIEEEFHREFNTNVLGPLLMIREAVKYFGPNGGSIINIGSAASQLNPPNQSIYTATKSALDAITRVLAKELGPKKIRVNSINPGATATEGARAAGTFSDVAGVPLKDVPRGKTPPEILQNHINKQTADCLCKALALARTISASLESGLEDSRRNEKMSRPAR